MSGEEFLRMRTERQAFWQIDSRALARNKLASVPSRNGSRRYGGGASASRVRPSPPHRRGHLDGLRCKLRRPSHSHSSTINSGLYNRQSAWKEMEMNLTRNQVFLIVGTILSAV